MPTSTRRKHLFYGGFPANPYWFSILRRRGGRPCPPAGIARFYGKPMRNRNILRGRCGHRPLRTTSQNCTILESGQGRPPLQRGVGESVCTIDSHTSNVGLHRDSSGVGNCPFSQTLGAFVKFIRGRCLHRPAESTYFMVVFRRIRIGFLFCAVGADDPVRPPELRVFTENRCEIAIF